MNGSLRVALVLDDSLDRPDGVQQHVLTLGRWLTEQGHDVHYVAPSTTREDLPQLHRVGRSLAVRANGNRLSTPTFTRRRELRTVLDDLVLDVVHVAMPCSPFLAGRLVTQVPATTAVVGTFHIVPAGPVIAVGARVMGLTQRRQLRRFDRMLAVSDPARQFADEAFGLDAVVVPNPIDVEAFVTERPAEPGSDPVRILFLGRLVERKGAPHLLRAVAAMRRDELTQVPFRVTVAGRGPLLEELQAFVRTEGLDGVVDFPGFVAEDQKAALLAEADVVALPSLGGESFGISVVEALAATHGTVLAGDNAGYREVMGPLTDQLVPAQDTARFARLLAAHVDGPRRSPEVRTRQLAQARNFDVELVGPRVVATYRDALAARRGRPVPVAVPVDVDVAAG
ncbi:glycosyltransferase family 4 protein [Cellulomonas soli]|uniref:glycosyltransferase family 4 protein n=1 Tax=Cellulomonas soli TaxID=931535 RepID=UPI003F87625A